jgi:lysophospholipase L1-like esterase
LRYFSCLRLPKLGALVAAVAFPLLAHAQDCRKPQLPPTTAIPTPQPGRAPVRLEEIKSLLTTGHFGVIALGDSIMAGWPSELLDSAFGTHTLNAGFGQDKTEDVLWRLDTLDWSKQVPRYVLLLIGTGDVGHAECDVYWGILAVAAKARLTFPTATVIVTSILPRGLDMRAADATITGVNQNLERAAAEAGYVFLNAHREFLCANTTPCSLYRPDNLHLARAGYEVLSAILSKLISAHGH